MAPIPDRDPLLFPSSPRIHAAPLMRDTEIETNHHVLNCNIVRVSSPQTCSRKKALYYYVISSVLLELFHISLLLMFSLECHR